MLALSLVLLSAAPAPLRVAVPSFNVINVEKESADFFMDRFATRLRSKGLAVTTATEMETVLGLERQKTLLGCADSSSTCQAEIAAALGADGIVRARIARFGQRFELSLTLIDPTDAAVLASVSKSAADEGKVLDVLDEAADELSAKFLASKGRKGAPVPEVRTAATGRAGWVPLVPLVVGVGAGVSGAVLLAESYRMVGLIATEPNFESIAQDARFFRGLGIALIGVGVAGLATAAILFFTRTEPAAFMPVVSLSQRGGFVGLEGRLP